VAPLIVAAGMLARRAAGRTFLAGVLAGLVYFGGTLYWVTGVMQTYGGLSPVVSVLVAILLAAYLSIYTGLFAWCTGDAIRRFGVTGVWISPFFWVASEWLRSTVGGGFPWVLLGASQASVLPVLQTASVVGVYGLSALVALVSAAAAAVTLSRARVHRVGAMSVGLGLVLVMVGGAWRVSAGGWTRAGQPLSVGLVQGAVNQEDKYDVRFRDAILERYLDLSRRTIASGAQLVIWPEASTPFYFDANAALSLPIRKLAVESRTPFILGTDDYAPATPAHREQFFNAAVLLGADGRSHATYRKMHLVPFGEYVPLKDLLFFVKPLVEAVSDFSAGTEPVVFDIDGRRVSVAICYELAYNGISQTFVDRGSELLATITNDAWFGTSSAAYQHFDQAALRAVEQGRYVVRAANTGISGAVDPYGRVLVRSDLFVPTALTANVRLIAARTIYGRIGDLVAWMSLAVMLALLVTRLRGFRPGVSRGRAAPPVGETR
jgi:apolipoprotein N-acyltransferase